MKDIKTMSSCGNSDALSLNKATTPAVSGHYYVQETIGGWRQNAAFDGTLAQCNEYWRDMHLDQSNSSWDIVSEEDYEVDYL